MEKYSGECFCGAVRVEVSGEPAVMAVCHCKLCRGWSAAPVTGAALWSPENFKVTQGEDHLSSYAKVEGMTANGAPNVAGMSLLTTAPHTEKSMFTPPS